MCKLQLDFAAAAMPYVSLSRWSLAIDFFTIQGTAGNCRVLKLLHYERPTHQIEYII